MEPVFFWATAPISAPESSSALAGRFDFVDLDIGLAIGLVF
jgi:hypothetical protein